MGNLYRSNFKYGNVTVCLDVKLGTTTETLDFQHGV